MFFGMTNSPATFQGLMNVIFSDLIVKGKVAVYLDDILVFTATLEEHRRVVREVLERLRRNDLYLRPEKCEFDKTTIEYLGLVVTDFLTLHLIAPMTSVPHGYHIIYLILIFL